MKNEKIVIKVVDIESVKLNPSNPRTIKDDKFKKLVKSIQEFPEMLDIRPIVVNADNIVLGGNMRLKACQEAGLVSVPIMDISHLSDEKQREFIVKDNIGYGDWDFDLLAKDYDIQILDEWGIDAIKFGKDISLDEFFNAPAPIEDETDTAKIILEYTQEEHDLVKAELLKHGKTPEEAVFKLLEL